ncbi:MAG: FAD-dependent monooxygenase [Rhizonema sp. PD37]|nr:FAD-dependent monooxygenase [Rhizonema sp. PD37]
MTEAILTNNVFDIAIIGAGPGGLCAAHALANQGFSVGIFEQAHVLRPIGAALGLRDMGYAALAEISADLAHQVRALAVNPKRQMLMRPNGEVLFADESPLAGTSFTWLGWYNLQTCLHKALPTTVSFHLNHALTGFTRDSHQGEKLLRLQFRQQEDVYTRLLIGADGYNSVVRKITVADGAPLYTGTMTWRGIVERKNILPLADPFVEAAGFQLVVGEKKNFWIMDVGTELIAWGGTALHLNQGKSVSALETVLQIFQQWPPLVERMIRATDPKAIVETGVFDREPVPQWGDGRRVTLLGDAAHPMRPYLGLGTTMAIQDAVALAKRLASTDLGDSEQLGIAISTYEQERIAITAPLQRKARHTGAESHADDHADRLKEELVATLAARRQTEQKY